MKKILISMVGLLLLSGCSLQNNKITTGISNISAEQKLQEMIQQLTNFQQEKLSLENIVLEQTQRIQTLIQENQQLKQEIERYKQLLTNINQPEVN